MRKNLVRTSVSLAQVRQLILRTVPHDYEDLLSYYTNRGYRVIAIAGKSVEGLSWLKAQRMKRFAYSPQHANLFLKSMIPVNKQNQV